ncbi:MAG TPA: DUF192 domain-containing protein [bacterium]|nr:DUF192 domain-containing protein [bacterium]
MALMNLSRAANHPIPVVAAATLASRLAGLFALDERTLSHSALHLFPCSSIHTYALSFPIDVLFLAQDGTILSIHAAVEANRLLAPPKQQARSVVEAKTGVLPLAHLSVGDRLSIVAESVSRPAMADFRQLVQLPINIFLALFWLRFVVLSLSAFLQSRSPLGLGLILFNSLLFFFFITRRQSAPVDRSIWDWLIPVGTVFLSMTLQPQATGETARMGWSYTLQALGLAAMLYSLLSLGKSFGIVPANRTVVVHGAYSVVRHPLYASESLFYFGFLLGNFNWFNLLKIFLIFLGQLWRIRSEERVLNSDQRYREYCSRVQHRLLPGLF